MSDAPRPEACPTCGHPVWRWPDGKLEYLPHPAAATDAPAPQALDAARMVRGFVGLFDNMSAPDLHLMGMRHDSAILVEAREWLSRLPSETGDE